jgi:hypothetical protein
VPGLDEVAADPNIAATLPREAAAALYTRCALAEAALRARLLIEPATAPMPTKAEPEEWISAEEVTKRFGLDPPWLKRHRRLLRGRKILATPSRKKSVYSLRRLAAFLESQAAATGLTPRLHTPRFQSKSVVLPRPGPGS